MAEFRWILLGIGVVLLAGIWWWGARRSRTVAGNPELRESAASGSTAGAPVAPAFEEHEWHDPTPLHESREWGVPPFEPLSIRTADFDAVPSLEQPMMAHPDPIDAPVGEAHVPQAHPGEANLDELQLDQDPSTAAATRVPHDAGPPEPRPVDNPDRMATGPIQAPNKSERQRILTIRVAAHADARWTGSQLMAALEAHGLAHGRYQIYHRKHADGRSLFCVASLVEPGAFDLSRMPAEEYRGVTMFAVLPGPLAPTATLDALLTTAQGLAQELTGSVQDDKGAELTAERIAALRADVARFQALLDSPAR